MYRIKELVDENKCLHYDAGSEVIEMKEKQELLLKLIDQLTNEEIEEVIRAYADLQQPGRV